MRDGAPLELLAGSKPWRAQISSWRGSKLLHGDIRIVSGEYTCARSQAIPDAVSFTVARKSGGFDWCPGRDVEHPLAAMGQRLHVAITTKSPSNGEEYMTRLGRFVIQGWEDDDDGGITVTASGLLIAASDYLGASTSAPLSGGTFMSEIRRLVPTSVVVDFSSELVDRAVPTSVEYADDLTQTIESLLTAWPARKLMDGNGQMQVLPVLEETAVPTRELVDGQGGTVVKVPSEGTRDKVYNRVVVRGSDTDGTGQDPVLAVVDKTSGPFKVDVDGYGIKGRAYSSSFVTTEAQARAAGAKILADALAPARSVNVEIVPDPTVQTDDPVGVTTADRGRQIGYVIAERHPLTIDDGPSSVEVGLT